ncbi:MAG: tol-pal system protein YbgF [Gammaproteobacteria bacterium]|nr:tol-pal system protein YbgF [Gammaproteobacteria bacterium]MYD75317.1 tol-pal system protein YbgF [Gammaproteobacteria bacterium]MYJ51986.1 tol-pal system protein YbgF [Gammaproteobacteria bacterium]
MNAVPIKVPTRRNPSGRGAALTLAVCVLMMGAAGTVSLSVAQTATDTENADETQPAAGQSSINYELLHILNQLNEIKSELKQLRNSVEQMEFDNANAKRRQQELFLDIDRRLGDLESNQRVLQTQYTSAPQDGQEGDALDPGEGGVTQVVVVPDGSSQAPESDADESPPSDTGTEAQPEAGTPGAEPVAGGTNVVTLEEQNLYEEAFEMLKKSRYEEAIGEFQQLVDTWPSSQLADDAYYWMSEARYVTREFELALNGFKAIVEQHPGSSRVPEALLKIGYIHYDVGDYSNAAETFRAILERFPGHPVTVSAQTRLRRIEQSIQ